MAKYQGFVMGNHSRHFAVQAVDVDRARRVYEAVFAWRSQVRGAPNFYLIDTCSDRDQSLQDARV